jgi:hypothetical protein
MHRLFLRVSRQARARPISRPSLRCAPSVFACVRAGGATGHCEPTGVRVLTQTSRKRRFRNPHARGKAQASWPTRSIPPAAVSACGHPPKGRGGCPHAPAAAAGATVVTPSAGQQQVNSGDCSRCMWTPPPLPCVDGGDAVFRAGSVLWHCGQFANLKKMRRSL